MATIYYRPDKNNRAYWTTGDGTPEVLRETVMPAAGWAYEIDDVDGLRTGVLTEDDVADYASVLRAMDLVEVSGLDAHILVDDRPRYIEMVERQQGEIAAEWMRLHIESCKDAGAVIDLAEPFWTDWSQVPDVGGINELRAAFIWSPA